jgi:hypothetical protein
MKWRMTYSNKNMHGCSARGIAVRETKEELEALAEKLKENICNVKIEAVKTPEEKTGR